MSTQPLDPNSTNNVSSIQGDKTGPTGDRPSLLSFAQRSEKDVPPRRKPKAAQQSSSSAKPSGTSAPSPQSTFTSSAIMEGMATLYAGAGTFVGMIAPILGGSLVQNAETLGQAWANAAQQSPTMRRIAENLLQGNAVFALGMAHVPLGMAAYAEVMTRREAKKMARQEAQQAQATPNVPGPNVKVGNFGG